MPLRDPILGLLVGLDQAAVTSSVHGVVGRSPHGRPQVDSTDWHLERILGLAMDRRVIYLDQLPQLNTKSHKEGGRPCCERGPRSIRHP